MGAVFQKRFKSGAGSTHLVDSANHVSGTTGVLNKNLVVVISKIAKNIHIYTVTPTYTLQII